MNKLLWIPIWIIIIFSVINLAQLLTDLTTPYFGSYEFCEDQGYNYNGYYLDYKHENYGAIKCSKCFADGCEKESFNVTRNWRGELEIYDANVGVSE